MQNLCSLGHCKLQLQMEYPVNNKGTKSTDSCCADERKGKKGWKKKEEKNIYDIPISVNSLNS